MRNLILTVAACAALLASPTSASPQQRCDRDGCWTYDCDATSNHCHRHWISSSRFTQTGYQPGRAPGHNPGDQVCDSNGQNCQPAATPN